MSSKRVLADSVASFPATGGLDGRCQLHPQKGIVTAFTKFMAARDGKVMKQMNEGNDHQALAKKARELARRLSEPKQVTAYIGELEKEAAVHDKRHQEKLRECKTFWYGPEGLMWLAHKKGMESEQWAAYTQFMDDMAFRAFQKLLLRKLEQQVDYMDEVALQSLQEVSLQQLTEQQAHRELFARLRGRQGA